MTITVYTTPGCGDCASTRQLLDELPRRDPDRYDGLEYTTVNLTEDDGARSLVLGLRYQQAPVVMVRDGGGKVVEHWGGHQPGRLTQAAQAVAD